MNEAERAKRELKEAAAAASRDVRPEPPAPKNPELHDSQARGGAEMATDEGRTKPRDS